MPTLTYTLPSAEVDFRSTSSSPPRIVRPKVDYSFLEAAAGTRTVVEVKASAETTPPPKQAVRAPRVHLSRAATTERFTLLQKWEGVVIEADEDTFTGTLVD